MVHKRTNRTTNQGVADAFANGETNATSNNMFIDGNAVYSYGYHFPIAVRSGGKVYFNSDGYSTTTSIHKGRVRRALAGRGAVIEMRTTSELKEIVQKESV